MKNNKELNELVTIGNKILKLFYFVMIAALIIVALFIGNITNLFTIIIKTITIILPLFVGFLVAWIFNPLVIKMEDKKINRTLSSVIVILGICIAFYLTISMLVPVLYHQVQEFISVLPEAATKLMALTDGILESFADNGVDIVGVKNSINENISSIGTNIATALPTGLMNFIFGFVSTMVNVVLSLVLGLYILIDFENIKSTLIKFLPIKYQKEAYSLLSNIGTETRKCINGILLIAFIVALIATVCFSAVGLEAALLMGIICGITNIIPYIGPWIGGGIAAIIGFTQSSVLGFSIMVIVFFIQTFESCVLQPVIMGKVTAIHPIIIMVSLLVFGYFFGIIGMIFSTPVLAILKVIFIHFNNKYKLFSI